MATPVARRAPYKDFLQPALQRRFAGTAAIVLGLAYLEALTLSGWSSFLWSWFPLGPAGFRAFALFACVLPIIILRIAHAHMGIRTSNSILENLFHSVLRFSTIETVLTYIISAFFFSQVYLKSTPEDAGIRWISRATGRSRLNEHALFYTVNLLVFGLVQGVIHTVFDTDRLVLGVVEGTPGGNGDGGNEGNANGVNPEGDAARPTDTENWAAKIGEWTPVLLVRCGMLAITIAMVNYAFLYHFLRVPAWRLAMRLLRWTYDDLPKYNLPVAGAPWSVWMLGRTTWALFLLSLLWYFGELAFRVQLTREPLKKGQPLSSESKDPNGSLLNGLKSKKPRIFAFALWELAFITRDFTTRRQAIYEDIDRKDGPMWSQIYAVCIDTIRDLERRIDEYGRAPAPAGPASAPAQPRERLSRPIQANDVSAPRHVPKTSLVTNTVAQLVTSPGRTPAQDWAPVIKKEGWTSGRPRTLTLRAMALPVIGPFFQQTFSRRLAKAIFGSPYAETSVYINAAYALSQLAVHSLTEDRYGNVQRDVPTIIRTLTVIIRKLETFRDGFPIHWTDLTQSRQCPEVSEVLNALKTDLGALVDAFGLYSADLRLSRADMRLAREAAQRPQEPRPREMQQVG
ncbi:hypothetical protein NPX13_g10870 [Xylaria arbuscula]|uniref:Nucleoporin NDC1 n=1 Tax=Xylaria arbuscula TaxID=114810 RepID=A0A9W8N3R1_9PEZI|nr:hypothetical protein NPX13_g10870 [Xylaria arbuscula]